jgi:hypothetical protein
MYTSTFSPLIWLRTHILTMLKACIFHPLTLLPLRHTAHNTAITPAFYSELLEPARSSYECTRTREYSADLSSSPNPVIHPTTVQPVLTNLLQMELCDTAFQHLSVQTTDISLAQLCKPVHRTVHPFTDV